MNTVERLDVAAHDRGDWIVTHGARRTAVAPAIGRALLPLHGRHLDRAGLQAELARLGIDWGPAEVAAVAASLAGRAGIRSRRRALWLRVPLVPARWTAALARRLAPLTAWPALAASALLGIAGYAFASAPSGGPVSTPAVVGLFLLTALWHELGHAAALAREGYRPGGIGAGLLFLLPVLFADVSLVEALPRRGRLRVDLAGVGFQLGLGGLLSLAGARCPAVAWAGWAALFAVAWSLLPFLRSDGYWALCDALALRDLRSAPPAGRGRSVRLFVVFFRVASWLFLALACSLMVLRVVRLASRWLRFPGG